MHSYTINIFFSNNQFVIMNQTGFCHSVSKDAKKKKNKLTERTYNSEIGQINRVAKIRS